MKNRIKKSKTRNRVPEKNEDGPQRKHELSLFEPNGVAICFAEIDPDQVRDFLKFAKRGLMTPGQALWEILQSFIEREQAKGQAVEK